MERQGDAKQHCKQPRLSLTDAVVNNATANATAIATALATSIPSPLLSSSLGFFLLALAPFVRYVDFVALMRINRDLYQRVWTVSPNTSPLGVQLSALLPIYNDYSKVKLSPAILLQRRRIPSNIYVCFYSLDKHVLLHGFVSNIDQVRRLQISRPDGDLAMLFALQIIPRLIHLQAFHYFGQASQDQQSASILKRQEALMTHLPVSLKELHYFIPHDSIDVCYPLLETQLRRFTSLRELHMNACHHDFKIPCMLERLLIDTEHFDKFQEFLRHSRLYDLSKLVHLQYFRLECEYEVELEFDSKYGFRVPLDAKSFDGHFYDEDEVTMLQILRSLDDSFHCGQPSCQLRTLKLEMQLSDKIWNAVWLLWSKLPQLTELHAIFMGGDADFQAPGMYDTMTFMSPDKANVLMPHLDTLLFGIDLPEDTVSTSFSTKYRFLWQGVMEWSYAKDSLRHLTINCLNGSPFDTTVQEMFFSGHRNPKLQILEVEDAYGTKRI